MNEIDRRARPVNPPTLYRHSPHRALGGLVAGIVEFDEARPEPLVRRQPAGSMALLVIGLDALLTISGRSSGPEPYTSFVAGLSTAVVTTRFTGRNHCFQIYLTPLGVVRLLGVDGRELVDTVAKAEEVLPILGGQAAGELTERLSAAKGRERFAVIESELLARLDKTPPVDEVTAFMWRSIVGSGGQARIADLVAQTGHSHRYVTRRFADRIGVTPKSAAGLVRFERVIHELGNAPIAELAHRHGYSDQSHLTRAVRRYAGESPQALARARRPTAYTAMGISPSPRV